MKLASKELNFKGVYLKIKSLEVEYKLYPSFFFMLHLVHGPQVAHS